MNSIASWARARTPGSTDLIITIVVVALAGIGSLFGGGEAQSDPTVISTTFAIITASAVWLRRRQPVALLLAVSVVHVFINWETGNEVPLLPAVAVALFTVARHADRKVGLTVASIVGLAVAVAAAALDEDQFLTEFLGAAAFVAVPIALGDAARSRADRIRDLIGTEASTRVQAERIRIARDLHDVVAHGLSTIAIQSGVAAHLIDKDPGQAKEALEVINATGKSSLEELRVMVGVLRSTDDAPLRPTPSSPDDLTDLLDGANRAGIAVTVERTGEFPPDVGDSCVVAMHRIIQEAFTNIARHAGGASTTLRIEHSVEQVEINISNEGTTTRTTTPESTGVGIIGMRERAESLGGTLRAERIAGGGFRVVAVLPYNLTRERT